MPRVPGPCVTAAIWRCRKNSSQWQHSFQWKLHSRWLKFLRQRRVAVVRQGPRTAVPAIQLAMPAGYHARNLTINGSDEGLSLDRRQAIIWTNTGTIRDKLQWNFHRNAYIFIFFDNEFENVVCKVTSILSRPQRLTFYLVNCINET